MGWEEEANTFLYKGFHFVRDSVYVIKSVNVLSFQSDEKFRSNGWQRLSHDIFVLREGAFCVVVDVLPR